jgi:hypothetical protein
MPSHSDVKSRERTEGGDRGMSPGKKLGIESRKNRKRMPFPTASSGHK